MVHSIKKIHFMPLQKSTLSGHFFTFITIVIWSVAFVSNKALLAYISPIENMILRFTLGYLFLLLLYPKWRLPHSIKDEFFFILLGFLGIFIYFLLENFALSYTQAANVGLYMGAIPILTALFAHFISKDEALSLNLFVGFLVAMVGIGLILLEGSGYEMRLKGDLLALGAAAVFALYSAILTRAPKGYHYIEITRKSFFYAIIMMLLYFFMNEKGFHTKVLTVPVVWANILYLGVLSSGLAFILWHKGIEQIGSIAASNYIYLVPLITAVTGVFVLGETLTLRMIGGGILILVGLYLSQRKS